MEIKRDIHLNRIIARKGNGMIKVITGIRRCGKSYLLFTLFTNYLKSQGVDEQHIIKVDLEDRRNAFLRNPDALLKHIVCCRTPSLDNNTRHLSLYVFDETQNRSLCLVPI